MIGGRQSGFTVQRLPGASNALNGLYQPRHRIPSTVKSSVANCTLTLRESLHGNISREPEGLQLSLHFLLNLLSLVCTC